MNVSKELIKIAKQLVSKKDTLTLKELIQYAGGKEEIKSKFTYSYEAFSYLDNKLSELLKQKHQDSNYLTSVVDQSDIWSWCSGNLPDPNLMDLIKNKDEKIYKDLMDIKKDFKSKKQTQKVCEKSVLSKLKEFEKKTKLDLQDMINNYSYLVDEILEIKF
jgi:Mn-containing catalase